MNRDLTVQNRQAFFRFWFDNTKVARLFAVKYGGTLYFKGGNAP